MKRILLFLCVALVILPVCAQEDENGMYGRLFCEDYHIDTTQTKVLGVRLNAIGFFRDNEFDSSIMTQGYTLPGAILSPRLTYTPIKQIYMELGLHALLFNGANKYPNYAYHDIGTWKGNQYQSGVHFLPWVRLQAGFKHINVVLGDIYGGENHGLIDPLWNSETNLTQDPEMGLQLLWDIPHLHMDTWINWQSYIFKLDTHQEAFTLGTTWKVIFGKKKSDKSELGITMSDSELPSQNISQSSPSKPRTTWYLPIQILLQHRGGQQDTTQMGVQTICNGSIGAGVRIRTNRKVLSWMNYEVNALAALQQSGQLWPFDAGFALHLAGECCLWQDMNVRLGYLYAPKDFVSLYGNPLFGTVSISENYRCKGMNTVYGNITYSHTFAKHYSIGAHITLFQSFMGVSNNGAKRQEFNFSYGVYLHCDPSFIIKDFKKKKKQKSL